MSFVTSATSISGFVRCPTTSSRHRPLPPPGGHDVTAAGRASHEALAMISRLQCEIATARAFLEARSTTLAEHQASLEARRQRVESGRFDIAAAREVASDLADLHDALDAHATAWADLGDRAATLRQLMDEAFDGGQLVTTQVRQLTTI